MEFPVFPVASHIGFLARYHRLQIPPGNEIIELDDADKIERMDDIGKTCSIDGTVKGIKQYWH